MRPAEARLSASTMITSSIRLSLVGAHVDCSTNTSWPRTFSLISTMISPSEKRDTTARPEQERKCPTEHRIDNDRIGWEVAADIANSGALMRYCVGEDVLQSEAELVGAGCDLAAFGKAFIELPVVDVDVRVERDESRAGRLRFVPEQAPGMHDGLVAAIDEMLGNGQQGQDMTGHGCGGDEKARHYVFSLSIK